MSDMVNVVAVSKKWPWLRLVPYVAINPVRDDPAKYVVLPDGRTGVVDHMKADGNVGVRPLHPQTGEYLPNPAKHWTDEQRKAVPEEVSVHPAQLRPAEKHELPQTLR